MLQTSCRLPSLVPSNCNERKTIIIEICKWWRKNVKGKNNKCIEENICVYINHCSNYVCSRLCSAFSLLLFFLFFRKIVVVVAVFIIQKCIFPIMLHAGCSIRINIIHRFLWSWTFFVIFFSRRIICFVICHRSFQKQQIASGIDLVYSIIERTKEKGKKIWMFYFLWNSAHHIETFR